MIKTSGTGAYQIHRSAAIQRYAQIRSASRAQKVNTRNQTMQGQPSYV